MSGPRVSIVIPYLKGEATIARALDSVQRQSMRDFEVVAVSDGSTDRTTALLQDAARSDPRIRTIGYPDNRGPSYARNRAIDASTGEWVAVLDADDWYAPDRLERMLAVGDGADVVVDNMMGIDPLDGTEVCPMWTAMPPSITVSDIARAKVPGSRFDYGYLKPMYRRAFVERHGLRYREDLRTAEDMLFLLECCVVAGAIRTVDAPLYFYNLQVSPKRQRATGTTHTQPRVRDFGRALQALADRLHDRLTPDERALVATRIAELYAGADVLEFRHAFYTKQYGAAARAVLTSTRVRRYIGDALLRKSGLRAAPVDG